MSFRNWVEHASGRALAGMAMAYGVERERVRRWFVLWAFRVPESDASLRVRVKAAYERKWS